MAEPLSDEFIRQITEDYMRKWCTSNHLTSLDLKGLAAAARPSMEKQVKTWSETFSTQHLQAFFRRRAEMESKEEDPAYEDFRLQMQYAWFWYHFPVFKTITDLMEAYSKDHLNGDCTVGQIDIELNEEFNWKLFKYAFSIVDKENPNKEKRKSDTALKRKPKSDDDSLAVEPPAAKRAKPNKSSSKKDDEPSKKSKKSKRSKKSKKSDEGNSDELDRTRASVERSGSDSEAPPSTAPVTK